AGLGVGGVELVPAPPGGVAAAQHRLAQSLLNLVTNAVTHTPDGTREVVDASVADDRLAITVADDCPGFDPSMRAVAFEPLVRNRAVGSSAGRGLGLAIVRSLVEAERGTVERDSGPAGTRATITLPLDQGSPQPAPPAQPAQREVATPNQS